MKMIKRVYTKPTIVKIQLSHEQAVLSTCSALSSIAQSGGGGCNPMNCRRDQMATQWDSGPGS